MVPSRSQGVPVSEWICKLPLDISSLRPWRENCLDVQLMPLPARSEDTGWLCGVRPTHLYHPCLPHSQETPWGLCPLADVIPEISAASQTLKLNGAHKARNMFSEGVGGG